MAYKITINKVETIEKEESGGYQVVSEDAEGKPEYGFPPTRTVEKEIDVKVFEQIVDDIDMLAVIGAINPPPTTVFTG